jgi:hypothetical protein
MLIGEGREPFSHDRIGKRSMGRACPAADPGSFAAHYPIVPSAMILDCHGAASSIAPAKLFQQHFKGLTFNARQALRVKFER